MRPEEGSSTIELAIMLPILLILFAGTAELGRLFSTYTTLAKATEVGARYLSVSRDATSADATTASNALLKAQRLVVCGYTDSCTGTQPDGTPKAPVVPGLSTTNPATNVNVTWPVINGEKYVKVEIQGYTYQPGVFNIASMTGKASTTFYFGLTPATEMRYMPGS